MPSYYGIVFPEFWTGDSGRQIREQGRCEAQLLALYLVSNRFANMIGLYRVLVDDMRRETGVSTRAIARSLDVLQEAEYAAFDAPSSYVWVRHMARFRLGLKAGEAIDPDDNRVVAINKLYHAIDPNPFLAEFFDTNRKLLALKKRRASTGLWSPLSSSTTSRPFEGASKPLGSQVQRSGTGIRDQRSGSGKSAATVVAADSLSTEAQQNRAVIRELAIDIIRGAPTDTSFADLKSLVKDACFDRHIAYDAEVVGSALEQALARVEARR